MELLGRGAGEGGAMGVGCINGWKWRESHRGGGVSAVKSCYATPFFCGWRIASVKNGEKKKTALQLALGVLRVLVSPNHVALSCSPRRACC